MTEQEQFESIQRRLEHTVNAAGYYLERMEAYADARYCYWEGQTGDGRKHGTSQEDAWPWEGATDSRVRMIEEQIQTDVDLQMAAFARARINAVPTELTDMKRAGAAQTLLKQVARNKMRREIKRELELALNWSKTYALSFLSVEWRGRYDVETLPITQQKIQELVMKGQITEEELQGFYDPEKEELAVGFLQGALNLDKATARRAVREIGENGATEVEVSRPVEGLPKVRAMKPWVDVFFPTDTETLEDAELVWTRKTYTRAEVENVAVIENWKRGFKEALLAAGPIGKQKNNVWVTRRKGRVSFSVAADEKTRAFMLFGDESDLYEVFTCYRKNYDARTKALRCERLVMSPLIRNEWASWELSPYRHGKIPLIEIPNEVVERRLCESRSVPELLATHQDGMKRQTDLRGDRGDFSLIPPLRTPKRTGKRYDITLGPAAQLPDPSGQSFSFLPMPGYDPASRDYEQTIMGEVNRLFGRQVEGVSPTRIRTRAEQLVNDMVDVTSEMLSQIFALCQQYMSPQTIARTINGDPAQVQVDPGEIQGSYDVNIEVSADELDLELYVKKIEVFTKLAVPLDSDAVIDRTSLISLIARGLDPLLAETAIRDKESATQAEIEDEKAQFSLIYSGVPSALKQGQNYELRRKVLTEIMQANPAHMERFQEDETFRNLVENRFKFFNQQIEQANNRIVGAYGMDPNRQLEAQ